jgi:hypothetical protein
MEEIGSILVYHTTVCGIEIYLALNFVRNYFTNTKKFYTKRWTILYYQLYSIQTPGLIFHIF